MASRAYAMDYGQTNYDNQKKESTAIQNLLQQLQQKSSSPFVGQVNYLNKRSLTVQDLFNQASEHTPYQKQDNFSNLFNQSAFLKKNQPGKARCNLFPQTISSSPIVSYKPYMPKISNLYYQNSSSVVPPMINSYSQNSSLKQFTGSPGLNQNDSKQYPLAPYNRSTKETSGIQWFFDAVQKEIYNRKQQNQQHIETVSNVKRLPFMLQNTTYSNSDYQRKFEEDQTSSCSLNPTVATLLSLARSNYVNPKIDFPLLSNYPVTAPLLQPWNFSYFEDCVDDDILFSRLELQRRKSPRYFGLTQHFHDLHIVMPICVPYGSIVVEDSLGANFYTFDEIKQSGAFILFGKGLATSFDDKQQNAEQSTKNFSVSNVVCSNVSNSETASDNRSAETTRQSKSYSCTKSACDVWASFLHVRLGTIYNLTDDQMAEVVQRFRVTFDPEYCYFYVPISIDCHGLYPSTDVSLSQRAGRSSTRSIAKERYETRGVATTDNDVKRLRMLRRYLKRFALQLVSELGFNHDVYYDKLANDLDFMHLEPIPCIELHDNLRVSTLTRGTVKIIVREWSRLDDPDIFKKVWNKQLAASPLHHGLADTVWAKILEDKDIPSARVYLGELRLELSNLRMVEPRWPQEFVLGRRIADCVSNGETPCLNNDLIGRFVFCSRIKSPKVIYAYAKNKEEAIAMAKCCKLAELYEAHWSQYRKETDKIEKKNLQLSDSTAEEGDSNELKTKAKNNDVFKQALSYTDSAKVKLQQSVCKFFVSGGCARAEKCFFLHPADPLLESTQDVRDINPKNPKYF